MVVLEHRYIDVFILLIFILFFRMSFIIDGGSCMFARVFHPLFLVNLSEVPDTPTRSRLKTFLSPLDTPQRCLQIVKAPGGHLWLARNPIPEKSPLPQWTNSLRTMLTLKTPRKAPP